MNEEKAQIYLNNLEMIHHHFQVSTQLATAWRNDRVSFFQMLGDWLEKNTGAFETIVIFNDLVDNQASDNKPILTKSVLTKNTDGAWIKKPFDSAHEAIYKPFEKLLSLSPEILELGSDNLTIGGSLTQSPMLILCKFKYFDTLQQSLVKGLFESLSAILTK